MSYNVRGLKSKWLNCLPGKMFRIKAPPLRAHLQENVIQQVKATDTCNYTISLHSKIQSHQIFPWIISNRELAASPDNLCLLVPLRQKRKRSREFIERRSEKDGGEGRPSVLLLMKMNSLLLCSHFKLCSIPPLFLASISLPWDRMIATTAN